MKIQTKAVHAGDRKKTGAHVPATTPIYTASSYFYDSMEELDRVFGQEEPGYCYARYDNPTNAALEELVAALESGHGALACGSGMAAIHMALLAALADRRKSVLAANALYGATVSLLMNVMEAVGRERALRRMFATWTRFARPWRSRSPAASWWRPFRIRCCAWPRSTASPKSRARPARR